MRTWKGFTTNCDEGQFLDLNQPPQQLESASREEASKEKVAAHHKYCSVKSKNMASKTLQNTLKLQPKIALVSCLFLSAGSAIASVRLDFPIKTSSSKHTATPSDETTIVVQRSSNEGLTADDVKFMIKQVEDCKGRGDYAAAATIQEKLLAETEKLLGPNHPATTANLNNLALLLARQGFYGKAEALYIRAIAITENTVGPMHVDNISNLSNLGILYVDQGLYSKADALLSRAVLISERTLGSHHLDTAKALNNLANLYLKQGLYVKAEPLLKRGLAISEKALGPIHTATATALNNLGLLFDSQGLYAKAEPLLKRGLAISEKALGLDHPGTATALNNLGNLYLMQGLYTKAEPLLNRGLAISEKALGADHPDIATALNNLSGLYLQQGLYAKAESLQKRGLAISEKALGPDHPDTASSLNGLASIYLYQGSYDNAEKAYLRSLAIREKALGVYHPETGTSLNNLAYLYLKQGQNSKAVNLYLRALEINRKTVGMNHPNTASMMDNLGSVYSDQGPYDKAEPLYARALSIRKASLGIGNSATSASLNNLAILYTRDGNYSKAEPMHILALRIDEKVLGPSHPHTAIALNNLGIHYGYRHEFNKGQQFLQKGLRAELKWFSREASFLPLAKRQSQLKMAGEAAEVPFTWIESYPKAAELALESRLNRQGILLDLEQRQSLLARAPGPQRELAEKLQGLTQQLSSVSISTDKRQFLQRERERLEVEIYRQLPSLEIQLVTPKQVASALPEKGILVEFKKYRTFNSKQPFNKRWGPSRYMALILKPNASIAAVPLGAAKPIDDAINKALTATAQNLNDATTLWAQVSNLVIKPLQPNLNGYNQWFLSPDGELNRVPFAALPSPLDPAQPLADSVQLRLLTTGRDLLLKARPSSQTRQIPLVIVNPNYDGNIVITPQTEPALQQQRSAAASTGHWAALPATALEGGQVATLLSTQLIQGSDATVQRLQQSVGPLVIHVATHGFFAGDQPLDTRNPLRSSMQSQGQSSMGSGEDPMLRSAVVLAGANYPDSNPIDDGYLTALEATGLQLTGTELVVLSACSTGQGDIRSGEGVYGLQRALTVAGARSTLLSLWKVDDAATAVFMTRYYTLLKEGKGRGEALVQVQREFRTDPAYKAKNWDRPYYWAAWQLTGDWKPIQGL